MTMYDAERYAYDAAAQTTRKFAAKVMTMGEYKNLILKAMNGAVGWWCDRDELLYLLNGFMKKEFVITTPVDSESGQYYKFSLNETVYNAYKKGIDLNYVEDNNEGAEESPSAPTVMQAQKAASKTQGAKESPSATAAMQAQKAKDEAKRSAITDALKDLRY